MPEVCLVVLGALLVGAVWVDLRSRRVPNALVAFGVVCGFALQSALPSGGGLFLASGAGSTGLLTAFLGFATGLLLLMPLYLLRGLGAGDVKLFAMAGVWLGPVAIFHAALWTLVAGGLLALVAALGAGQLRAVAGSLKSRLNAVLFRIPGSMTSMAVPGTIRLPYAIAIAAGVGVEMIRQWSSRA